MHVVKLCNDPAKPTDTELAAAHKDVHDEFLAALMLSGANRDRYGALRNELANQFGFSNDLYPKTTDQCLTMMNRRMDGAARQPRAPRQPHSSGYGPIAPAPPPLSGGRRYTLLCFSGRRRRLGDGDGSTATLMVIPGNPAPRRRRRDGDARPSWSSPSSVGIV